MAEKRRISMYLGRSYAIPGNESGATGPEFNLPGRWKLIRVADVSTGTYSMGNEITYPAYRNAIMVGVNRYIHCLYTDDDVPMLAIDDRTHLELDGVYVNQGDTILLFTYNTLDTPISGRFAAVLTFEEVGESE